MFGVSSGLLFGYFNSRLYSFPRVINRSQPGAILKKSAKRLGVKVKTKKFWSRKKGERELDRLLAEGQPVCVQVDMFYMDHVTNDFRVHANVHWITIIGKDGDTYMVSDCYFPELGEVSRKSLENGRFARGDVTPRGFMFYPVSVPETPPLETAVRAGIKDNCFLMLKVPFFPIGIKGMRKFAREIVNWPTIARSPEFLGKHLVWFAMFMDDITGGGAFRYMYATFLQEAAEILNIEKLREMSMQMRENGDRWREFTVQMLRMGKSRDYSEERLLMLRGLIEERADFEEQFFKTLATAVK